MSMTPSLTRPDAQTKNASESGSISETEHDDDDSMHVQEQQHPSGEIANTITATVTMDNEDEDVDAPPHLQLVDDEFARAIIMTLCDGSKRGREIASICDASRPTIYRRLNRLESAGFVRTTQTIGPDGHECKEFELIRNRLTVSVGDGSVVVQAHPQE